MSEKVSIIIPVYNVEEYLKKCIDSLLAQTFKDIKIILVDDGSTDSSSKICDEYNRKDKRVLVIHKKNEGVSKARNTGLEYAHGKYVMFVDSDDWMDETAVGSYVKMMEDNNGDYLLNRYKVIDGGQERECIHFFDTGRITRQQAFDFLFCQHGVFGSVWSKLFLLDIIKKNNLTFDSSTRIAEDLLFNANYMKYAQSILYIKEPQYYYVLRQDSALGKFWGDYNEKWFEYLWVMKQFLYNDKYSYITCKDAIQAAYCRTCINVYARLRVYHNRPDMIQDIKIESKKYMHALLKSDTFGKKTRFVTLVKYICPWVIKLIDR